MRAIITEKTLTSRVPYKEAIGIGGVYSIHYSDGKERSYYCKYVVVLSVGDEDNEMYAVDNTSGRLSGPLCGKWTEPRMLYEFEPNLQFVLEP